MHFCPAQRLSIAILPPSLQPHLPADRTQQSPRDLTGWLHPMRSLRKPLEHLTGWERTIIRARQTSGKLALVQSPVEADPRGVHTPHVPHSCLNNAAQVSSHESLSPTGTAAMSAPPQPLQLCN